MEFKYFETFFSSFGELFNKKILLLPQVYLFILSIIYAIVELTVFAPAIATSFNVGGTFAYTSLISYAIFLIVFIFVSVFFVATNLSNFRQHIDKKKVTAGSQIDGGKAIYWKVLGVGILTALILLVPAAVLIGLASLTATPVITSAAILLVLIWILLMAFHLFFANVNITKKNMTPVGAINKSFATYKKNKAHVIKAFLTIFLLSILYVIILMVVAGIIGLLILVISPIASQIITNIIIGLLAIPLSATTMLYTFKAEKAVSKGGQ